MSVYLLEENIEVFQEAEKSLFLCAESVAPFISALQSVASAQSSATVFYTENLDLGARLTSLAGLQPPALMLLTNSSRYGIPLPENVTEDVLLGFLKDIESGAIAPSIQSAPRPENDADPEHPGMVILTAKSFKELVIDAPRNVLVDLYADWCGPCRAVAPHLYVVAEVLQRLGVTSHAVAKMDVDANDVDRKYFPEPSIPNIKLFLQGNKENPIKFDKERNATAILRFLHSHDASFDLTKALAMVSEVETAHEKAKNKEVISIKSVPDFNQALTDAGDKLVAIDFFATWCGPCIMFSPIFANKSEQLKGEVVFLKVDVDAVPALTEKFDIEAMPTFVFMKGGKEVHRFEGASESEFDETIATHK